MKLFQVSLPYFQNRRFRLGIFLKGSIDQIAINMYSYSQLQINEPLAKVRYFLQVIFKYFLFHCVFIVHFDKKLYDFCNLLKFLFVKSILGNEF
ncbi:MAG: hypothetical protein CR988_01190 [Treponema sp.]|nr:MAG: hypothetical protein CR988_01190 [Treponema sp.]